MGKVPVDLRKNVAANIRNCRTKRYPKWGGSKRCAEEFGVSPQQWSQWERGAHMPDEFRMRDLAEFFNVSIDYLRRNNAEASEPHLPVLPPPPDAAVMDGGDEDVEVVEAQTLHFPQSYVIRQEWVQVRVTVERIL